MTKATEALKMEQEKKARAKQDYMDSKVKPLPNVESMNEANLVSICKDLHAQILAAEEQKYDSEMKIRKILRRFLRTWLPIKLKNKGILYVLLIFLYSYYSKIVR